MDCSSHAQGLMGASPRASTVAQAHAHAAMVEELMDQGVHSSYGVEGPLGMVGLGNINDSYDVN